MQIAKMHDGPKEECIAYEMSLLELLYHITVPQCCFAYKSLPFLPLSLQIHDQTISPVTAETGKNMSLELCKLRVVDFRMISDFGLVRLYLAYTRAASE